MECALAWRDSILGISGQYDLFRKIHYCFLPPTRHLEFLMFTRFKIEVKDL